MSKVYNMENQWDSDSLAIAVLNQESAIFPSIPISSSIVFIILSHDLCQTHYAHC